MTVFPSFFLSFFLPFFLSSFLPFFLSFCPQAIGGSGSTDLEVSRINATAQKTRRQSCLEEWQRHQDLGGFRIPVSAGELLGREEKGGRRRPRKRPPSHPSRTRQNTTARPDPELIKDLFLDTEPEQY
ncbi:uncharacterized protein LY79DRAFT_317216 [Colletotrichum navitas]|uniref:Uncharacterized protein n=1 Tax=Colletotrichum navitas TaxID=681940 RepID=A0AAD8V2V1_9PEZI|nr:uncharacterized protein LY79DRAFT_317216 [Colletotrichum navitas]KAK1580179.1 hypothetical protein LY79DRAFT_317216 [Colletotrichum navitas]